METIYYAANVLSVCKYLNNLYAIMYETAVTCAQRLSLATNLSQKTNKNVLYY